MPVIADTIDDLLEPVRKSNDVGPDPDPHEGRDLGPAGEDEVLKAMWIGGAIKNPGQLHRDLGVPEGEKIPRAAIEAACKGHKDPKVRKRACLALTLSRFKKKPG